MDKSISVFVFDTPESCDKCTLMHSYFDNGYGWIKECMGSGVNDCVVFERKLEDYCPLKQLPQKKTQTTPVVIKHENDSHEEVYNYGKIDGYNECLDEILGDK